ncbi:MAG: zinc ribbon domain-containing protein [Clostridia bacterium]|nr:zinc ribbon domain-containing protein [Clostridia bacterium]
MAFCEKCGAMHADGIKFCDKCGAPTNQAAPAASAPADDSAYGSYPSYGYSAPTPGYSAPAPGSGSLLNTVRGILPPQYTAPGNKTMFFIGFGAMVALAITYIACMFAFISDMSLPIGQGADLGVRDFWDASDNANPLWMVILMAFSIVPAVFAAISFKNPKFRLYSVFASAALLVVTLISLLIWGIWGYDNVRDLYEVMEDSSYNLMAWNVLMDCLSETWYLKIIFPVVAIFGYGVDYLVNKNV